MVRIFQVTNVYKVTFNVRLVQKGDEYGLDNKLTHDEDEPLVEFYDTRYPHTEFGQFISRYYRKTLLGSPSVEHGLDLHGGERAWVLSPKNMRDVVARI